MENPIIGITHDGESGTRSYEIRFMNLRNPPKRFRQIVYVDFEKGGEVCLPGRFCWDSTPFDITEIDPDLDIPNDEMKALILDKIRTDFSNYNIDIRSSIGDSRPSGSEEDRTSTLYIVNAYNEELLGIAEHTDKWNSNLQDVAIVFGLTFQAFNVLNPTPDEMAQAFANVASQETGHNIALTHTRDPTGVMDITASLRELMENQNFKQSILHEEIYDAGDRVWQNAPALLGGVLCVGDCDG